MNQYWWGDINKAAKSVYLNCPTCPKYKTEKSVHTAPGHFKLPNRSLEFWQVDVQLLPSRGYKYVLVVICMFSHWTELSLEDKLMPLQWQKSCWKRLFPLGELLSNATVIEEPFLLVKCYNKSVLFGWLHNIFTVLITLNLQV